MYNKVCGGFCPVLIPITETDWKLEPMLVGKGSSGPDGFDILGYQALHIHFCPVVMELQEVPADFENFRKVHLVFNFFPLLSMGTPDMMAELKLCRMARAHISCTMYSYFMECFQA